MLRLPPFLLLEPRTIDEAVQMRAAAGDDCSFVAGGTDLYPNMKRRQQTPATVISLARIAELKEISGSPEHGVTIGACASLTAGSRCSDLHALSRSCGARGAHDLDARCCATWERWVGICCSTRAATTTTDVRVAALDRLLLKRDGEMWVGRRVHGAGRCSHRTVSVAVAIGAE